MKKFTKEKGITLIALVITIIVMLILVAVTLSVALNGGLFSKANDAARKTQIEIDREELQAALLDTMDDNGDLHLGNIATYLDTDDTDGEYWEQYVSKFTRYHKNGDVNQFTVTIANGGFTVAYNEGETTATSPEAPEDLVKYALGAEGTGRSIWYIVNQSFQFQDDPTTQDIDESTAVSMLFEPIYGENSNTVYAYARYSVDENIYRIKILMPDLNDPTTWVTAPISTSEPIKLITTQDENVGKTATIDGEKYIVLYGAGENGSNIQLISANTYEVDNVDLGYNDNWIDWTDTDVIEEANIFPSLSGSNSVLTNEEKSIYSYNNAITTLNAKCSSVIGNTNSDILDVRCVGSNPTSKNSENNTMHTSSFLQNSPTNSSTYTAGAFNGTGKETDVNYLDDFDRLFLIDAIVSENDEDYWMASRVFVERFDNIPEMNAYYAVRCMKSRSPCLCDWNIIINVYSHVYARSKTEGVRPVITISPTNLAKYLD